MRLLSRLSQLGCIVAVAIAASIVVAQAPSDLAKQAKEILKERCYSCHGEGGANEGGFNYVLNRKRLSRELIVPGSPDESKLFERVFKGEMPPDGDRLPKAEIETLRKWIDAGAPPFATETKRAVVSPVEMLGLMLKDLEKADERDRPFYRYFTLTHLFNAGFEDNELESHRQGLSKLVNSLSWGREIKVPLPIDSAKTILRIDLRHYKWNENDAWSKIIAVDPYHVVYSIPSAVSCYALTKCELPHVRADWFVFAASRPPLYNLILGLPETPEEMLTFEQQRLGVNVAQNLRDYSDVVRAGFYPSGVSKSVRLIERHVSSNGSYWKSYDFKPIDAKEQPPKRRNLKANPTGPGGTNGFEHDGGEMIFSLPNGLQGYMLTDAVGKQIPKGPTDVVVDKEAVKRGRDPEVVNGVSCMNCHWSGMLNKSDQIRQHVLSQQASYSAGVIEFVKAVYAEKAILSAKLQEDRDRFDAAVKKCGLPGLSRSEPVATLAYQFDEPLDLESAASEVGVPPDKLTVILAANATLGRELGSLTQGQSVPRETFVQQFPLLVQTLDLGEYTAPVRIGDRHGSQGVPTSGDERNDNSLKLSLVWCPPGKFTMGSPLGEEFRQEDEKQVSVELTQGFWLGKYEVTQEEFEKVMRTAPWKGKDFVKEGENVPASYISHDDAVEFCRRLTASERTAGRLGAKDAYSLPTEAQWEFACRGGTKTAYSFGMDDTNLGEHAWFDENTYRVNEKYNHPVGLKKPNAFGLYDMHGNVWEWCRDGYGRQLPGGADPEVVDGATRVLRGGSWGRYLGYCRSANRTNNAPELPVHDQGFRISRTPK